MAADLTTAEPFDMLHQPRGPYRLTPAEFEALDVPAIQRDRRAAIREVAAAMFAANLEGTGYEKITAEHELGEPIIHMTPGVYVREFHMAAGLRVVGMRHRQEHINVVSCGRATVMTEQGKQEVTGPCQFISPAGTQRFLWVHEDMIWTTIHRTDKTTPEEAFEDLFIDETPLIQGRVLELKEKLACRVYGLE